MTLKECYAALGGDYEDVVSRLRSERLVQKFALKFLEDGSYDLLCTSMENGAQEDAFRAAHTIKGICQNLNFTRLGESSSEMTEALRAGDLEKAKVLFPKLSADYQCTVDAIKAYQAALPQA